VWPQEAHLTGDTELHLGHSASSWIAELDADAGARSALLRASPGDLHRPDESMMLQVVDHILASDALLLLEKEADVVYRRHCWKDGEGGGGFGGTDSAGNVEGAGSALEEQLASTSRLDGLHCEREEEQEQGQGQVQEVRVCSYVSGLFVCMS
jgi:hypothetical protein